MSKILSSLFSKLYETFRVWFQTTLSKPESAYNKRIISYMEKHPKASLAEARGHKPKKKMVRITVGTGISVSNKIFRFTKNAVVSPEDVELAQYNLINELYSEIEKSIGYDETEFWFEPKIEIGVEALEIEGS